MSPAPAALLAGIVLVATPAGCSSGRGSAARPSELWHEPAAHVGVAQDHGRAHSTSVLLYGPDDHAHVSVTIGGNERAEIEHDLPVVSAEQPAG